MKTLPTSFRPAALAALIFCLMLNGCGDRSAKVTKGDGETQTVNVADAVVCVFSLGLLCPQRTADSRSDAAPSETLNAPRGITAIAAGDGIDEISLSWQETDDRRVVGYRIYRDGSLISESYRPAYTDSLLDSNRSYCYRVVAVDESLNLSAQSEQACATTSWQIATVRTQLGEARPSIAVDALGQAHLAYVGYDASGERQIAYANSLSGTWHSEIVGREHEVFTEAPAIVFDAAGSLHIGTQDSYVTNALGGWQAQSREAHNFSVMALDSKGYVHLISAGPGGVLNHTTNVGGGWASEAIGSGSWQHSAMVVDDRDILHVVYQDFTERQLVYANNAGGGWTGEIIATDFSPLWRLDLAVDAQRRLHLSYQTRPTGDIDTLPALRSGDGLGYASNASGRWRFSRVDSGDSVGAAASIAVDARGHAHISYTNRRQDELRYATNAAGVWRILTIARGDAVDLECRLVDELCGVTAIAIDRQGKVHIGYHDSQRVLYISNR